MNTWALVFLGGGLGSLARFSTSKIAASLFPGSFPYGTLLANVLSCLLLGFVVSLANEKGLVNAQGKILLVTGFCGGFSTFSTFSFETLELLHTNQSFTALTYIAASLLLCLSCVWTGMWIGKTLC